MVPSFIEPPDLTTLESTRDSSVMGNLFIVSGPSGSGKTSLCQIVLGEIDNIQFSVSYTTRMPRRQEQDGTDYFFIHEEEFHRKRKNGEFLEWARVYGNYYATGRQFVLNTLDRGIDVLLDIDIQGAQQVKERVREAVTTLVFPPSHQLLRQRLEKRALDRREVIQERLQIALEELIDFRRFDYLIINESLNAAAGNLKSILSAHRCRTDRQVSNVNKIISTFRRSEA